MGGKGKGKGGGQKKKLSAEDEAKQKADAVDDIDDEGYKKNLRMECRELVKAIEKEENLAGLFQDER